MMIEGYDDHYWLLDGRKLLPCPFCGSEPYIDSCDRIINIGCKKCGYHLTFHGLVQSDLVTDVVASRSKKTGNPIEWYDNDAYQRALDAWNRRANDAAD